MRSTATDAIEAAVMLIDGMSPQGRGRPGWAVSRLNSELRESLRALTSNSVHLQSFGPFQKRLVSYGLSQEPRRSAKRDGWAPRSECDEGWGRRSKRWS